MTKKRGEAWRIKWTNPAAPMAAVQTSHRIPLELGHNVTHCWFMGNDCGNKVLAGRPGDACWRCPCCVEARERASGCRTAGTTNKLRILSAVERTGRVANTYPAVPADNVPPRTLSVFSHAVFMTTKAEGRARVQVAVLTLTNHHTNNRAKAHNSRQSAPQIQQATGMDTSTSTLYINTGYSLYRLNVVSTSNGQHNYSDFGRKRNTTEHVDDSNQMDYTGSVKMLSKNI